MRALLLIVAVAACVPPPAFVPATMTVSDGAFDRVIRSLVSRGESIETKDKDAGIIVTKWTETTISFPSSVVRTRWNVTLDKNQMTVRSQCQTRIKNNDPGIFSPDESWSECSGQPEERSKAARDIAVEAM